MKLTHNSHYANIGSRLVASFIDTSILNIPLFFSLWIFVQASTLSELLTQMVWYTVVLIIPCSLLSIFYRPWMISRWGKTIGKFFVHAKVELVNGKLPSLKRSLFRELVAKPINYAVIGYGFFWIAVDPKHQSWHDHLTGTVVIQEELRPVANAVSFILLSIFWFTVCWYIFTMAINNTTLQTDIMSYVQQ